MGTIAATVRDAAQTLKAHSESPRLDAELLLGQVLGLSRAALIARDQEPVPQDLEQSYLALVRSRAHGVPIAYLTGNSEFWSLPLHVTSAVLVPRPETEVLVERALQLGRADSACTVLDLGTGSGAIALAVASERSRWQVTAVDVSAAALAVAAENARRLNLLNIAWRMSAWFDALTGERFDLILSNPPYIAGDDPALASLAAEPLLALSPGPTGLEALSHIIAAAPRHLTAHGRLLLEHGATQSHEVAQLLEKHGFTSICTVSDFSGKPRVTLGTYTSN